MQFKFEQATLRSLGFGYRSSYISKAVRQLSESGGREWLQSLHADAVVPLTIDECRTQLLRLAGVGPKVSAFTDLCVYLES